MRSEIVWFKNINFLWNISGKNNTKTSIDDKQSPMTNAQEKMCVQQVKIADMEIRKSHSKPNKKTGHVCPPGVND